MMPETPEEAVARIVAERGGGPPVKQAESRRPDGRFAPGVSGNPHGRPPRALCLTDLARQVLAEEGVAGRTAAEDVVRAWVKLAKTNPSALRELLDRTEGKPTQHVELETTVSTSGTAADKLRAALDLMRSRQTAADIQADADARIRELQADTGHERS
jgi:hypothetical protein